MIRYVLILSLLLSTKAFASDSVRSFFLEIKNACPKISKKQMIGLFLMGSGIATTMAQNTTNTTPCNFPCQPFDILQTYAGIALEFIGMLTFTGDFISNYIFYRRWYPRKIWKLMEELDELKQEEQELQIKQILRALDCLKKINNSEKTQESIEYIKKLFKDYNSGNINE